MLEEAMAVTFKEALIIVGVLCVAAGLIARQHAGANKGLGVALIIVGTLMIVAWPLGRMIDLW